MDITTLFNNFGVWGLSGILMLETGFLPLFFLPGDTLLFTAGYLIHAGDLPINNVFIILSLGAFLGNIIGYFLGFFAEKSLMKFVRNKAVFNKRIEKTHKFYEKYGLVTLVFARFIPSVRTIAPFLAGVALMPFLPFLLVSFFSAIFWVGVGLALGYFFGTKAPNLDHLMVIMVLVALIGVFFPILVVFVKKIWGKFKKGK